MTIADLIRSCQTFEDQHGIERLLIALEDIMRSRAQANGFDFIVPDEDEAVIAEIVGSLQ